MNALEPAPSAGKPAFLDRLPEVLSFQLRFLFFRTSREELLSVGWPHFAWGLFATWIAGVGRWWDDDDAVFLQILGLGSVVYVFVLAAVLWVVVRPLIAPEWKYGRVVTLLMFTSPLAWLYAIPVEKFMSIESAAHANLRFLQVVALWRVAILFWLLVKVADFGLWRALIAGLMPLAMIVGTLVSLNLHNVTFRIMGGFRDEPFDPDEGEFLFLFGLMMLAYLAAIPLILCWICTVLSMWNGAQYINEQGSDRTTGHLPPDLLAARHSSAEPPTPTAPPKDPTPPSG